MTHLNARVARIVAGPAVVSPFAVAPMAPQAAVATTDATGTPTGGTPALDPPAIVPYGVNLSVLGSLPLVACAATPAPAACRVRGIIRPKVAAAVYIDRSIRFTAPAVNEHERETPPVAQVAQADDIGLPMWVWLASAGAAVVLLTLSLVVWRLARGGRRTDETPAPAPLMRALPDPDPDPRLHDQDDRHDRIAA